MLLLLVQGSILRSRDGSVSEDARDERNMSLFRAPAQGLKRRGMSGVPRPSGISEVDPMDLLPDPASGRLGARRPLSHHGVMSFFPRGPPAPAAPGPRAHEVLRSVWRQKEAPDGYVWAREGGEIECSPSKGHREAHSAPEPSSPAPASDAPEPDGRGRVRAYVARAALLSASPARRAAAAV